MVLRTVPAREILAAVELHVVNNPTKGRRRAA